MSSSSSLSTVEDIVVDSLSAAGGSAKFRVGGEEFELEDLDSLPVYEKFKLGAFSAPSLRRAAESELIRTTSILRNLSVKISGGKDCAKHTGLFSGTIPVRASSGTLVRFSNSVVIKGHISGNDADYPNTPKVRSKTSDGNITLQANTNYIIHGDDSDCEDSEPRRFYNHSVIRVDGELVNCIRDIPEGCGVVTQHGKFIWFTPRRACSFKNRASKFHEVVEPRSLVTDVSSGDHRRNFKLLARAVTLCRRIKREVNLTSLSQVSRLQPADVLGTLSRDYLSTLGVNPRYTCFAGFEPNDSAQDFTSGTELEWNQLRSALCRNAEGRLVSRRSMLGKVSFASGMWHLGLEGEDLGPYEGSRIWAGVF